MALPISLQLYSVREEMGEGFEKTVRAVAEMGYAGVEPAGFPGTTVEEAAKLFRELGLRVSSAHTGMPIGEDKNRVLDEMELLGTTRIVSGKGPDDYATSDKIKEIVKQDA